MWGPFPFFETPVPPHFLFICREEISKSTSAAAGALPREDLSGEQETQQLTSAVRTFTFMTHRSRRFSPAAVADADVVSGAAKSTRGSPPFTG